MTAYNDVYFIENLFEKGKRTMGKDYSRTARTVLECIGGEKNVKSVTHCMTRLRFRLEDETIVDNKKVKAISGVAGVVKQNRFEYFMPMSGGLTLGGDGSTDVEDATRIADSATASGYDKHEYYVFAATGTKDVAYQGLTAQMEYMKTLTNAFDYTDNGFAEGNLMYYTVKGNRHDYQYTYEYVFNGLQCLFSWYEGSITQ